MVLPRCGVTRRSGSWAVVVLASVTLARLQKLRKVLLAIEHANRDAKEPNATGLASAKQGDPSDA